MYRERICYLERNNLLSNYQFGFPSKRCAGCYILYIPNEKRTWIWQHVRSGVCRSVHSGLLSRRPFLRNFWHWAAMVYGLAIFLKANWSLQRRFCMRNPTPSVILNHYVYAGDTVTSSSSSDDIESNLSEWHEQSVNLLPQEWTDHTSQKRKDRVDDFWNECEKVSPSTGETAQTNGQYATYKHNKLKLFACALRPYLNFETRFYKTEE